MVMYVVTRAVPRNLSWGFWSYILPIKTGAVPMTEEYLFIREDFTNKCNKLTSYAAVPRIQNSKIFADRNGKFGDMPKEIFGVDVTPPAPHCRYGPDSECI